MEAARSPSPALIPFLLKAPWKNGLVVRQWVIGPAVLALAAALFWTPSVIFLFPVAVTVTGMGFLVYIRFSPYVSRETPLLTAMALEFTGKGIAAFLPSALVYAALRLAF